MLRLALALTVGAVLLTPAASLAGERRALVVGNQSYRKAALTNTRKDAADVAARLEALGFQVTLKTDLSRRQLREAVDEYLRSLRPRDISFVYYAGHGIQVAGENYLLPLDFAAEREADVEDEGYRLHRLIAGLDEMRLQLSIVVLDACRDNPFQVTRSLSRGLAGVNAGTGTLIAFSTSPGKTASDGTPGGNGVYTASLLRFLDSPGLEVESLFKAVREDVANRTAREQVPWSSSSIVGAFYLRPGGDSSPAGEATSQRPATGVVPAAAASTPVAQTASVASAPPPASSTSATLSPGAGATQLPPVAADDPRLRSALRVLFEAGRPGEKWSLRASAGTTLCPLPCVAWVGARSGLSLRLEADKLSEVRTVPVPASLNYAWGRTLKAVPQQHGFGPNAVLPTAALVVSATIATVALGAAVLDPSPARVIGAALAGVPSLLGVGASAFWLHRTIHDWEIRFELLPAGG